MTHIATNTTTGRSQFFKNHCHCTNAVVAIWVVFVHATAVGAVGVHVKFGLTKGDFPFN